MINIYVKICDKESKNYFKVLLGKIREERSNKIHEKSDAFILVAMSHGHQDVLQNKLIECKAGGFGARLILQSRKDLGLANAV